jgi:hypothetical protein
MNCHVSPASVIDAVPGYRAEFRPSAALSRPVARTTDQLRQSADDTRTRSLWPRLVR